MNMNQDKNKIITRYSVSDNDTGSTEVQIGLLTERIKSITFHLSQFPKDKASKHGLLKLVGKRRRFLEYLKKKNHERYQQVQAMMNEDKKIKNNGEPKA